jgi:hypothetical protein
LRERRIFSIKVCHFISNVALVRRYPMEVKMIRYITNKIANGMKYMRLKTFLRGTKIIQSCHIVYIKMKISVAREARIDW